MIAGIVSHLKIMLKIYLETVEKLITDKVCVDFGIGGVYRLYARCVPRCCYSCCCYSCYLVLPYGNQTGKLQKTILQFLGKIFITLLEYFSRRLNIVQSNHRVRCKNYFYSMGIYIYMRRFTQCSRSSCSSRVTIKISELFIKQFRSSTTITNS